MFVIMLPLLAAVFAVGWSGLPGGIQDIDVNDEGLQNALNFAVVQHNRGTNDVYLSQVAEVISAQSQVVAGIKYIIKVKMAKTPCRKTSVDEVCAIHTDPEKARPYQCTFTVWNRPWLHDIRVLKETC
uniref:Cystatin C (amyloid angiopathy and cerebral hemorrhage) n=1 Tax=Mastacembelus armatus TaxID=205130 RepID=A0A3Q3N9C3_9TELE